jgi:hypothetical protein
MNIRFNREMIMATTLVDPIEKLFIWILLRAAPQISCIHPIYIILRMLIEIKFFHVKSLPKFSLAQLIPFNRDLKKLLSGNLKQLLT